VLQDEVQPITATYTVRDRAGARWPFYGRPILQHHPEAWYVKAPDGTTLYMAKEDTIIYRSYAAPRAAVRPLADNFIIVRSDSDDAVGEFNRKFTLLDRYVLDLRRTGRTLDRRVALALGVMLDTGERR